MAETLSIDAIKNYLIKVGCKIEYPILVNAFKQHLYNPDAQIQGKIRTQFKDYVNRLATVSLENNMKFINLRPEFRPSDFVDGGLNGQIRPAHQTPQPPVNSKDLIEQNRQQSQQSHQQLLKPMPIQVPVSQPRSQHPVTTVTTGPHTSKSSLNSNIVQHAEQNNFQTPVPTQYQPQQQHFRNASINIQQNHPNNHSHQQHPDQRSSPAKRSPTSKQQQPILPPQRPPPNDPVLQSRHQNSLETAITTTQPQLPKQMFQNHSIASSTAECPQEHLNQLSSLTSNQTNVQLRHPHQQQHHHRSDSLDTGTRSSMIMPPPPPRPPPRRRQSSASLFKPSPSKQPIEKSREIHDLAKRGLGRVKEHALKLNSSASSSDLNVLMPLRNNNNSMKENRLSRDSGNLGSLSSALQRNGSHLTNRSRSSHREDESDSSSLQPTDPLRRRWAVEASNCNYNGLIALLKEDPKLATHKDIINGYTALHWAAKFGNLDIIKLIAGTHNVSVDIKSSAGYTPLHIAYMFDRPQAAELMLRSYNANSNIRDHSGKRPKQYAQQQ